MRIHSLRILRIEDEEVSHAAQVKHAPTAPAIVSDVGTGHVAGDEDGIGVVRAYGGVKHRPAAARANDLEVSRTLSEGRSKKKDDNYRGKEVAFHQLLRKSRFLARYRARND